MMDPAGRFPATGSRYLPTYLVGSYFWPDTSIQVLNDYNSIGQVEFGSLTLLYLKAHSWPMSNKLIRAMSSSNLAHFIETTWIQFLLLLGSPSFTASESWIWELVNLSCTCRRLRSQHNLSDASIEQKSSRQQLVIILVIRFDEFNQ